MIVKIKNKYLGQGIDLLFNLSLKGKKSRHRTKLIRKMQERFKEVEQQRLELAKEHAQKDEEDNPIIKDNVYKMEDKAAFNKDYQELLDEKLVLDSGDDQEMLKTMKNVLLNCDKEFSGQQAVVYDALCDAFEGGEH
jgi:hypothetical protein